MSHLLGLPTIAGYTAFLRESGINATVLPDSSFSIQLSFAIAKGIVSPWLCQIDADIYTLAVYNLATDRLIYFAQDQAGQTFFGGGPDGKPPGLRQQYGINAKGPYGLINASHDETTGQAVTLPEWAMSLTLLDLQNFKTPFGLQYLTFAQMIGPSIWGLS